MASLQQQDALLNRLAAGSATSPQLEQLLGQSQATMSRRLRRLISDRKVIRLGVTRGARYALLRVVEGIGSAWPLRRIDAQGKIHELGVLNALAAGEYFFQSNVPGFAWAGIGTGLPYFLQDQRPGGFLGRAVPRRYPELKLPQRVSDWSDDHYLRYLVQRGADPVSDLILGDSALNDFLASQRRRESVHENEREQGYPRLAKEVMEGGLPGSSAHGEHPKFATLLQGERGYRHVLVKFSPPTTGPVGQRWSDLLIAEHVAHKVLRTHGVSATMSEILQFADRTYLEVDRFDREALDGRIGVTSLLAIDAHLYGTLDSWVASAGRLHRDRRIDDATLRHIKLISTFGSLIANTDRHFGNLAFFDRYDGRFSLAPVYDMLPMLFAPEHDQLLARVFEPPAPTSESLSVYGQARTMAEEYWNAVARDSRISQEFRNIGATCGTTLAALSRTNAYV